MADLREIEGIGPAFAAKLEAIGINSVEELLEKGAHTRDREEIAAKAGLTYTQVLEWVNRADLARIKGIGSEYADLLEFAGVDTVMELARRRADNLTAKMAATDRATDLVRRLPTEAEVADWIAQARALERKVFYEARSGARAPKGTPLTEIEGIGPVFAAKLEAVGIETVEELLEKGAHTKDREAIAEQSGLTYEQVLEWVNRADLARIKGIGSEYADLLEFAGVDTVPELAQRRADNLTAKLAEINAGKDLVRRVPTETEVADWIAQAKALERKVFYEARSRSSRAAAAAPIVAGAAGATEAAASPVPPLPPVEDEPVTPVAPEKDEVVVPLAAAAALGTAATSAGGGAAAAALAAGAIPPVVPPPVAEEEEEDEAVAVPPPAPTPAPVPDPVPAVARPVVTAAAPPPPVAAPVAAAAAETGGNRWVAPLIGLLALGVLGWLLWPKGGTTPVATATPGAASSPVAAEATPGAAAAVPVVAAATEKDIVMLYDGGTKDWIVPAADAFNEGRTEVGRIYLNAMGSREGRDNILYQKDRVQPVLWSPSDAYWVDKLKRDAANPDLPAKSGATAGESRPLARTYLVFLMPEAKAKAFEAAAAKPEYQGRTWTLLRRIATDGWGAVGGPADWGRLKLAQTDPTRSNSGMTALTLMFAEFAAANPGKGINDRAFLDMMGTIEGAVAEFAPSTSELMESFTADANKADLAVVYESEALRAMEAGEADGLRIVYPSPTVAVTVPVAEVEAKWVSEDRANLAAEFMEYLQTDAAQEKALAAGYRPVSDALAGKVSETIAKHAAHGAAEAPKALATEADTKTKEGLIYNWDQWHRKRGGA